MNVTHALLAQPAAKIRFTVSDPVFLKKFSLTAKKFRIFLISSKYRKSGIKKGNLGEVALRSFSGPRGLR